MLWPFGRTVVPAADRETAQALGNVGWAVVAGWWLALGQLITGVLLCCTAVGLPLGVADLKLVPLAFAPFGKRVVPISEVAAGHPLAVRPLGR